ncbi:hypothetical protein [Klebsiella pneumoniae IS43]|uniref:Uncharacterized protein n=1 Tax=Klebsiella pneumoniae IS43 TaxID=1432552 RepID=W1DLE7_KLEPN|nr:hypothetical protein [Klebsiella pneumoniae IS43]
MVFWASLSVFYQPGFAPGAEAYGDHPHFIVSTSNDSSNG